MVNQVVNQGSLRTKDQSEKRDLRRGKRLDRVESYSEGKEKVKGCAFAMDVDVPESQETVLPKVDGWRIMEEHRKG